MKRLALLGSPEGLARQDIAPTDGFSNPIIGKSYLESATPKQQSFLNRSLGFKRSAGYRNVKIEIIDRPTIAMITIIDREQWRNLQTREAVIELNEPTPLLVVEVVSESTKNTDYKAKRSEYSILDIPEYWVVDPLVNKVTIFILEAGWYEPTEFQGNEVIKSPTFPELRLAANQILDRSVACDIESLPSLEDSL